MNDPFAFPLHDVNSKFALRESLTRRDGRSLISTSSRPTTATSPFSIRGGSTRLAVGGIVPNRQLTPEWGFESGNTMYAQGLNQTYSPPWKGRSTRSTDASFSGLSQRSIARRGVSEAGTYYGKLSRSFREAEPATKWEQFEYRLGKSKLSFEDMGGSISWRRQAAGSMAITKRARGSAQSSVLFDGSIGSLNSDVPTLRPRASTTTPLGQSLHTHTLGSARESATSLRPGSSLTRSLLA